MALIRFEIEQTVRVSDVPKDKVDATLYFDSGAVPMGIPDHNAWAAHIGHIWFGDTNTGTSPFTIFSGRDGKVITYDMADPKPRPERGVFVYTPGTHENGALGPRHVASCLSFYSGRNLPSYRGRVFIGPHLLGTLGETIPTSIRNQLMDLAQRLQGINASGSTVTMQHFIYSEKMKLGHPVTNYWCNDVWDTQRRRLSKETLRVKFP
jgi:hypothetical protein